MTTAIVLIIGILAILLQGALYYRKRKYYRLRIGTLQRDYNDVVWRWSEIEASFDKARGKMNAECELTLKKINALQESINLYMNENKLLTEELNQIKHNYIVMKKQVEEAIKEDEASPKDKVAREVLGAMDQYMEVVAAYQHLLVVPEVKAALLAKGEESLKNLSMVMQKWQKVEGILKQAMEKHLPHVKKVMNNPRKPEDAVTAVGIREIYDELDFEQKIQVLEAECPDFISTQEDLINSIDTMIRVKALDHPLMNYEESSDALKQVKRLYEKLNFIIEDAKAKNPEWLTLKN